MDLETLNIARLAADPNLLNHYARFCEGLTATIQRPALAATFELVRSAPPQPSADALLDQLVAAAATRIRSGTRFRIKGGEIKTSAGEVLKCIDGLREPIQRIEADRQAQEPSLREWMERQIVLQGTNAEPNYLAQKDPLACALDILQEFRETKPLYGNDQERICFPFENYSLVHKPTIPTSIEPLDQDVLNGGAEEESVLLLSGETNIGKSHLGLFSLSSLCLRRESVILCSGEDSQEITKRRAFAHFLRMPRTQMLALSEKGRLERMRSLYGHEEDPESLHYHIIRNFAIRCVPEGTFRPQTVADVIDEFEQSQQRRVRAVMADYLQKMDENPSPKAARRARDEALEIVVNQLKEIAAEKTNLILLISQVPSSGAGTSQEMLTARHAVARSYAATWGAQYIITVNRTVEETRRQARSADKRGRLDLFLCKSKDTPLGICYALSYPNESRWEFFHTKSERDRRAEMQQDPNEGIEIGAFREKS